MNKASRIIVGILVILGLTGLTLYRRYHRQQIRMEQQEKQQEMMEDIYERQKVLEAERREEELQRRTDSVRAVRQAEHKARMDQIEKIQAELEKQIEENNKAK